ncbi:helix-turn-helix domain-containing protein [Yinghuangia seranimata]|uniref:helix-turn-helix domain-containing protein n=1 Tax=Yinghuangia seranimata TaxID=408067 RepID=UPI00248AC896|nr:helix-turn-helix transcriptional regulator [Yinghuangia seranimata]
MRGAKDERGLSLSDLAALTHYSRASWQRWLSGSRLVTPFALDAFAVAAELDPVPLRALLEMAKAESTEGSGTTGASVVEGMPEHPSERPDLRKERRRVHPGLVGAGAASALFTLVALLLAALGVLRFGH